MQERYSRSGTQLGFRPKTDALFHSSVQSICDLPRNVRSTLSLGLPFRDRKMIKDGHAFQGLATCFVSCDLAHNLSKKVGKPLILLATCNALRG